MRLRLAVVPIILTAVVAAATGCDQLKKAGSHGEGGMMVERAMPPMAAPAPAAMMAGSAEDSAAVPEARRIIRSANLTIEVRDVAAAAERARGIVADAGGFVANSRTSEDDAGRRSLAMTLRIPEPGMDAAVAAVKALGHVRDEQTRGEDVTEQYVDLEARLANARRLEERIVDLLAKQSKSLKDILDVERELARVREQIETMTARKRSLDNRLSLATIELTLTQPPGWGRGIFDPLAGLFQRTLGALTSSAAVLVVVAAAALPWIVVLGLALWLSLRFLRWWLHRRRALRAKAAPPPSTDR